MLVEAKTTSEVEKLVECYSNDIVVLSRLSNVLVSSKGVRGLVLIVKTSSVKFDASSVTVDAGVSLIKLSKMAREKNLGALEWACGIPGSVGGAIVGNAGAYNSCIGDITHSVCVLRNGKRVVISKDECGFCYRKSNFAKGDIVLSAKLNLTQKPKDMIDILTSEYQQKRKATQPSGHCCGSVFMANEKSAGYYIDQCNLKGFSVGKAMVSPKHANFIINTGGATSDDVVALIKIIKATVYKQFGVRLQEEVKYIGEF